MRKNVRTRFSSYHLLLALISVVPPRRPQDYAHVLLVGPGTHGGAEPTDADIRDAPAYIDVATGRFVCRRFKTAKSQLASRKRKAENLGEDPEEVVEPFETTLPAELMAVLRGSLARIPRRRLFPAIKSNPTKTYKAGRAGVSSFEKWTLDALKKVMGQPASFNDFRHAFVTYLYRQNPTMDQLTLAGYLMGHDVKTQLAYRVVGERKPIKGLDG